MKCNPNADVFRRAARAALAGPKALAAFNKERAEEAARRKAHYKLQIARCRLAKAKLKASQ